MAQLIADSQLDMYTLLTASSLAGLFEYADVMVHTSTIFQIKDVNDTQEVLTLTGNFTYSGSVYPTGGTITGGSYSSGNTPFGSFSFTGFAIGVEAFTSYVNTDDMIGLFAQILQGADQITGSASSDVLYGFGSNDVLQGGGGNDYLFGDGYLNTAGADTLIGGAGADVLIGGGGADIFKDTKAGLNGDTIYDFTSADSIVFTDASLANFTFSLSGNVLTYAGGSLTFTNVPGGTLVASAASGGGVQLVIGAAVPKPAVHNDFDGNGLSDILLRHDDGTVTNWLAQPNGTFTNNSAKFTIGATSGWAVAGTGDFNGDGRADIMWRASDGTVTDWIGQADGTFFNNYAHFTINASPNWHIAGTGDFNGDGRDDIMWLADDGTVTSWLGQADGTFFNNWAKFMINASPSWHIIGTGDYNGDGNSDILWRADDGTVTNWLGQSDGSFFNNWANFTIKASSTWHIIQNADFNGDGKDDILWRADDGTVTDWLGQANGGFFSNGSNFLLNVSPTWHIVGAGDFNGDGKSDILWQSDAGSFSDWFGQANGALSGTGGNYNGSLPTQWHVQDSFFPVI